MCLFKINNNSPVWCGTVGWSVVPAPKVMGTHPGCGLSPWSYGRQLIDFSLPLAFSFSPFLFLKSKIYI